MCFGLFFICRGVGTGIQEGLKNLWRSYSLGSSSLLLCTFKTKKKQIMIDNFEQISKLLKFEDENEFYFIQVLQRNKENRELGSNNRLVKAYYIYSLEQLEKYKNEMISLCQTFNARLYIHLNRRNARMIALEMMEDLAHSIKSNQFHLSKIYSSVCGRHHSKKDKTWILDVDEEQISVLMLAFIEIECHPLNTPKEIDRIKTKNGWHIITKPFNTLKFCTKYPEVEIHKNNPSVLFIPD